MHRSWSLLLRAQHCSASGSRTISCFITRVVAIARALVRGCEPKCLEMATSGFPKAGHGLQRRHVLHLEGGRRFRHGRENLPSVDCWRRPRVPLAACRPHADAGVARDWEVLGGQYPENTPHWPAQFREAHIRHREESSEPANIDTTSTRVVWFSQRVPRWKTR